MNTQMAFEKFIAQDVDCDVFNTLTDSCDIAFVGPIAMTDAGKEEFSDILNLQVRVDTDSDYPTAVVEITDSGAIEKLRKLRTFLKSAAGYCPQSTWDRWFYFPDETEESEEVKVYEPTGVLPAQG